MKRGKSILIAVVYICTLTLLIAAMRSGLINFIVNSYSTIHYNNDTAYQGFITGNWFVFAYAGIAFGFTYKSLDSTQVKNWQWAVAWLYDFLSYFVAVLICTLYNNHIYSRNGVASLSSVENFTLFFVFIFIKPLIIRPVIRIEDTNY